MTTPTYSFQPSNPQKNNDSEDNEEYSGIDELMSLTVDLCDAFLGNASAANGCYQMNYPAEAASLFSAIDIMTSIIADIGACLDTTTHSKKKPLFKQKHMSKGQLLIKNCIFRPACNCATRNSENAILHPELKH